jgi:hypothetical protein
LPENRKHQKRRDQTFSISEREQQIFLIADKFSKEYCNATLTLPAGQEDISLSGGHVMQLGSNPFRFDGVQLTEDQLAKQKQNGRKGIAITVAASFFGFLVGFFLVRGFLAASVASPKTFTNEDFQITLTDAFDSEELDGFFAFYQSKSVMVFTVREDASLVGNISLEEYGNLVLEANNKAGSELNQAEDYLWFAYTETPEDQEIYYLVVCCKSEDAYWIVNFATPSSNREDYHDTFLAWADTIEVGSP